MSQLLIRARIEKIKNILAQGRQPRTERLALRQRLKKQLGLKP